jgi:hypothetical protein
MNVHGYGAKNANVLHDAEAVKLRSTTDFLIGDLEASVCLYRVAVGVGGNLKGRSNQSP